MYYYNPKFERNAVNTLLAFSGFENKQENKSDWQSNHNQIQLHQKTEQTNNEHKQYHRQINVQSPISNQKQKKLNDSQLDINIETDQPTMFFKQTNQQGRSPSSGEKFENKIKKSQSLTASSMSSKKKQKMIEQLILSYKKYQQQKQPYIIKVNKIQSQQKIFVNSQRKLMNSQQQQAKQCQQLSYLFSNQNISKATKIRANSSHNRYDQHNKFQQNFLNISKIEVPQTKQEIKQDLLKYRAQQQVSQEYIQNKQRSNHNISQKDRILSMNSIYQISFECLRNMNNQKNKKYKRIHQQNANLAGLLDQESAHAKRLNDISQVQKSIRFPNQQNRSTSLSYKQNFFLQNLN